MARYFLFDENGDCLWEAPFETVKNGKTIRGYNASLNEEMLLADGYKRYDGHKDKNHIKLIDGEIVEIEDPIVPQTVFTKLQIRRAMRKLQLEDQLNGILSSNMQIQADWNDAKEIDLNDPMLKIALGEGGITDEEIQTIIDNIEEQ